MVRRHRFNAARICPTSSAFWRQRNITHASIVSGQNRLRIELFVCCDGLLFAKTRPDIAGRDRTRAWIYPPLAWRANRLLDVPVHRCVAACVRPIPAIRPPSCAALPLPPPTEAMLDRNVFANRLSVISRSRVTPAVDPASRAPCRAPQRDGPVCSARRDDREAGAVSQRRSGHCRRSKSCRCATRLSAMAAVTFGSP